MEPAAMLIRSLEIEIGGKPRCIRMRSTAQRASLWAAHHGLMGRTGIEPYIERIGQLAVLRGIDAEIFVRRLEPCLDAAGLNFGRRKLQQGGRIRVQLLRFPV